MRKEAFQVWLCAVKDLKISTAVSRTKNCERIELFEGDLDELFAHDRLVKLLKLLSYSRQDQRQNVPARHRIPIDGDLYNGTATLRRAARLYQEFMTSGSIPLDIQSVEHSLKKQNKAGAWPIWDIPTTETVLELTKIVTPYIRFLHPNVVKKIVEDNECNRKKWRKKLIDKGIAPDYYIWEKSSCAFPGIRRHVGSKEIAYFRKQLGPTEQKFEDALKLDDNSFPKHIWSFILRGKNFQNSGPKGYSLSHLADHKAYKNRWDEEFEITGVAPTKLHGLYSCASNTVYMPNALYKLTDFNTQVRLLLLHKAQSLYGTVCNLLPPGLKLKPQILPEWHLEKFKWNNDSIGADAELDSFFQFRNEIIDSL